MIVSSVIPALLVLASSSPNAQYPRLILTKSDVVPAKWGQTFRATIKSNYLGQTRKVDIFVPASFKTTVRRYPVIFLPDGEYDFERAAVAEYELSLSGHIPQCIVAAIETPERTQDLTPPGMGRFLAGGEEKGEKFLLFIAKELRPALDRQLRASNPNIFVGHSHGGILAHYAAAAWRKDFPFILSLDAPVNLSDSWLVNHLTASTSSGGTLRLVSLENRYGWTDESWKSLTDRAPKDWQLIRQKLPNETHETMVFSGMYLGLEDLFEDYSIASVKSLDAVHAFAHYESLTKTYGAFVIPPRDVLERAVNEITITGDGASAHRALKALSDGYGSPTDRIVLEKRIDVAAAKMKGQPSVQDLLSMPKPAEAEMKPFVGVWEGTEHVEGGPTDRVTVEFRLKDGRGAGTMTLHPDGGADMPLPLTYIKVVPNGIEFGFMNGIFPVAIVNHIGKLQNGKLVGMQAFAGVYFVPIMGEQMPKWSFAFVKKS
jgi:hypothetical protein